MKTIIVATDFSDNAYNALQYAGSLAACLKARIVIYHFVENPLSAGSLPSVDKSRLAKMASEASAKFDIKVDFNTKVKNVTIGLGEAVEETKADLVVVGMHASHWNDKVFGNTTTSILRSAQYPVLVVPEKAAYVTIENILLANNTHNIQSKNILPLLNEFADYFKAKIKVLHVEIKKNQQPKNENDVAENLTELNTSAHEVKIMEHDDVVTGIEKGIEQHNAQLLVMVPHRLNLWEGLLHNSTTRAMALRTHIPLLALPSDLPVVNS